MLWGEIMMCSGMSNLIDLIICSGRTVTAGIGWNHHSLYLVGGEIEWKRISETKKKTTTWFNIHDLNIFFQKGWHTVMTHDQSNLLATFSATRCHKDISFWFVDFVSAEDVGTPVSLCAADLEPVDPSCACSDDVVLWVIKVLLVWPISILESCL